METSFHTLDTQTPVSRSDTQENIYLKIYCSTQPLEILCGRIVSPQINNSWTVDEHSVHSILALRTFSTRIVGLLYKVIKHHFEKEEQDWKFYIKLIQDLVMHISYSIHKHTHATEEVLQTIDTGIESATDHQVITLAFTTSKLAMKNHEQYPMKDLTDLVIQLTTTAHEIEESLKSKNYSKTQKKIYRMVKLADIAKIYCTIYTEGFLQIQIYCKREQSLIGSGIFEKQHDIQQALGPLKPMSTKMIADVFTQYCI